MTAMTAMTLDLMSGGRFLLGLGTSGPQVAEGWHGEAWGKPLARTREYVEIVRAALRREALAHEGEHYRLGRPKPLKLMARPLRAEIPVYLASISPRGVELAAEIADGWIPIFFVPEKAPSLFPAPFHRESFDVAACVEVALDDDLQAARDSLKPHFALYVGGMGSRRTNFYNDLFRRYGYEREAEEIQSLYLDGHVREAATLVPDAFVDEVALVGSKERIGERLDAFRTAGVTTLICATRRPEALRALADLRERL